MPLLRRFLFVNCRFIRNFHAVYRPETIFALSSGQMRAGVAVVRISGKNSKTALTKMTRSSVESDLIPRHLYFTPIRHPVTMEIIDRGMAVWFPGPKTFTGEDSCEFHVHGGSAVLADLLDALSKLKGFSHAEPGEFTKRAFFNGKLDLTEVEGLADLLNAETSAQRKLALRQSSGELRKLYSDWRKRLLKCVAHLEAYIDFSEDDQIEDGVLDSVNTELTTLSLRIKKHLSDSRMGERLRNGVHVAIVGEPNVGKSTLLNFLCRKEAAIVTPIPGTTRDLLEVPVNIGGYPVLLTDTAGIRDTEDIVEREGVKRARKKLKESDLIMIVMDAMMEITKFRSDNKSLSYTDNVYHLDLDCLRSRIDKLLLYKNTDKEKATTNYKEELIDQRRRFALSGVTRSTTLITPDTIENEEKDPDDHENRQNFDEEWPEILLLLNKSDLIQSKIRHSDSIFSEKFDNTSENSEKPGYSSLKNEGNCFMWRQKRIHVDQISCKTMAGMDQFVARFADTVGEMCGKSMTSENPLFTHQRHRHLIEQADQYLDKYFQICETDLVSAANCLRAALSHVGKLTGDVTTEEILDCIFRDFCIGK